MEFFDWANIVSNFFGETITVKDLLTIFAVAGGIYVICLVFGGIGMYTMAKKAGLKNRWLAFIPFANTFYAGKLAGECNFFGQKMKRGGLYAAIAEFVCAGLNVLYYVVIILLAPYYVVYPAGDVQTSGYQGVPDSLLWMVNGKWVVNMLSTVAMIVQTVLLCIVFFALYRKYYARSPFMMTFVSVLFPFRGFVLFAVRNNTPVDYNEYVRRRAEEYRRQSGQPPYDGQYGNQPYNQPYNNQPYNNQPYRGGSAGDPFSEFGGGDSSRGGDPFAEFSNGAPNTNTPSEPNPPSSPSGENNDSQNHND